METCLAESCAAVASGSPGNVFLHLIRTLLAAQCALADNSALPHDRTADVIANPEFDFIVVGGGTAGSILASRLSEVNNWNVLLIERGTDPSIMTKVPAFLLLLQTTPEDYSYQAEPDSRYCQAARNKNCIWAKGKGLGGSSNMNGMIHLHGTDRDYNNWAEKGNVGWSYEEILPYFRKSENYHPDIPAKYGKKYFGVGGPMNIRSFNYSGSPMVDIITSAVSEFGIPKMEVFNGDKYIGFGNVHGTLDSGVRISAASAFLSPASKRGNLFVMKSTRVDSVIMNDKKAVGVRATLSNGKKIEIKANKEVILSAGTVASPQILMLSGIGPKKQLEEVGIIPIVDLPVGQRVQDHVIMFNIHLAYQNESSLPMFKETMDSMYDYLMKKSGPLISTAGIDFVGFINVDDPKSKYPNVQYHFVHIPKGEVLHIEGIANAFGMNDQVKGETLKINQKYDAIIVGPSLIHPKSSGRITLRSANPEDQPKIYPNYFDNEDDVEVLVKSIKFLKQLEKTSSFKKYGIKLQAFPIVGCEHTKMLSDDYWRCSLRHTAATLYHPVGSSKMGPENDPEAVVNPRLKVHSVEGLRVIDASIIPEIPGCNTNSPTMMIAEKGADMIKQDWNTRDEL